MVTRLPAGTFRSAHGKDAASGGGIDETQAGALRVRCTGRPKAIDMTTEEYPGFATDLQAQYMAWMTVARWHHVCHRDHF